MSDTSVEVQFGGNASGALAEHVPGAPRLAGSR